jgi:catechol 2,3-dioxygenase-like lactoylglutathione lyase family enzyme
MSDTTKMHRKFAIQSFNGVWELLDKEDRSPDDDVRMIHMAHTSRYHWGEIGTPLEFARGDWQIARVYAVLGFGVMAFKYAKRCLDLCEKHDLGDFDLAFAYEAMARASAVSGDVDKGRGYLDLARDAGMEIRKEADREYFFSELKNVEELL